MFFLLQKLCYLSYQSNKGSYNPLLIFFLKNNPENGYYLNNFSKQIQYNIKKIQMLCFLFNISSKICDRRK